MAQEVPTPGVLGLGFVHRASGGLQQEPGLSILVVSP